MGGDAWWCVCVRVCVFIAMRSVGLYGDVRDVGLCFGGDGRGGVERW